MRVDIYKCDIQAKTWGWREVNRVFDSAKAEKQTANCKANCKFLADICIS